jgi:glycosyltransferase involved in cell wall biosynthesis
VTEIDQSLPKSVLYATSARIGGVGLDAVAHETLRGIQRELSLAIAYGNRAPDLDANKIANLQWHPVRLLANLERKYYYNAKKRVVDRVAARYLRSFNYDLFHGWAGDALHSLRTTKELGIPSLLEIPTWHKHQGKTIPPQLEEERAMANESIPKRWLNRLIVTRLEVLEEYELADLILVLSEKAEETFLFSGIKKEKLFRTSRGVDVERFHPGAKPSKFRALFVGALIQRKGVHLLLEAWKKLNLPDSELLLVGHPHPEIQPYLQALPESVRLLGFNKKVEEIYRECSVFIFPSELEGSAKATYEAAASGLAQITTKESGDVVVDGLNGLLIPPHDVDSLCHAILKLYQNPGLVRAMGDAGRQRVVEQFTWDHFRERIREAYRTAITLRNSSD